MDKHYSGVSEYTYNLIREIFKHDRKNNYKLFYNSGRDISKAIPEFNYPNVEVVNLRYPNKIFNYVMQKSLRYPKIDQVLGVDLFFMPHINFISLSANCKKLITVHDLSFLRYREFFSFRKNFWHKFVNVKELLNRFDTIIAVSENTKRDIIELTNINESKIKVIYSGIKSEFRPLTREDDKLAPAKKKYNLPDKFILYLGTVEPRKNVSGIIKAFSRVKDSLKSEDEYRELKLVIAGARGWKSKSIFKDAGDSKYKDDIIFLGYVNRDDKISLYNLAALFVYVSFYEGFGFPPLEAMACGCPTIAGATSSLFEIAQNGALTVNPHNITEITNAVIELLKNSKFKDLLISKGIKASNKFKWENSVKKYLDIFNDYPKNL